MGRLTSHSEALFYNDGNESIIIHEGCREWLVGASTQSTFCDGLECYTQSVSSFQPNTEKNMILVSGRSTRRDGDILVTPPRDLNATLGQLEAEEKENTSNGRAGI